VKVHRILAAATIATEATFCLTPNSVAVITSTVGSSGGAGGVKAGAAGAKQFQQQQLQRTGRQGTSQLNLSRFGH
jgi:hypothetical protein